MKLPQRAFHSFDPNNYNNLITKKTRFLKYNNTLQGIFKTVKCRRYVEIFIKWKDC